MQIPAQISFINLDSSPALEERIRQKIAKLETRVKNLVGLHVFIEAATHRHHNKGFVYSVRIDATLPGGQLVVSHHPGKNAIMDDKVYAAMNTAFAALEKQLTRFKAITYHDNTKPHAESWQEGVVSNIAKDDGYGFISNIMGDEIYFHRNSVHGNHFGEMDIGWVVRYVPAEGEGHKGPQASAVKLHMRKKKKG